ncbi:MAG: glycolate oxidase subunit GlcF [Thermoflexales bacterium]
MQHQISAQRLGPLGETAAAAVSACVHCGFCLPACPTYQVLGDEMNSPRGRILLMKGVLEGSMSLQQAAPYISQCLGCLACATACPAGVQYGALLTAYRAHTEPKRSRSLSETVTRWLLRLTLPYPSRFRAAATIGQLVGWAGHLLPRELNAMLHLLPGHFPKPVKLKPWYAAVGERRARVALLAGCVQQVLAPHINQATIEVLTANGVEVIVPPQQVCCGALALHTGEMRTALKLARHNLRAFPLEEIDAAIANAAGCGSALKEYGLLLKGTPESSRARMFSEKARDVNEFLDALGLRPPHPLPRPMTVAYHDACHLAHAQGVWGAPRRLLRSIPNVAVVEVPEGEICCGSAGTYNIEHPHIAQQLGERKARNLLRTNADAVATSNIGCIVQIQTHLAQQGSNVPVLHTMELLAMAYRQATI